MFLVEKKTLLKPVGALYIIGGLITVISAIMLDLVSFRLGTLLAIPAFLIMILVGLTELTAGRTTWRSEVGSWRSIVTTSIMVLGVRLLFVSLGIQDAYVHGTMVTDLGFYTVLFYLNLVLLVLELVVMIYIAMHSEFFMAQEGDGNVRPDLTSYNIKSASECPHCHEVVETYWQSCPYCGTKLPRVCVDCGGDLGDVLSKCPHCGKEIMHSVSLKKTVETFQKLAKEDALPETKAIRYARLAEALIKNGQSEDAVAAYRQAMEFTKFPRKRTNFMVQAARILKNTGHQDEARKLLNEALALDPEDYAGAAKLQTEMSPKLAQA